MIRYYSLDLVHQATCSITLPQMSFRRAVKTARLLEGIKTEDDEVFDSLVGSKDVGNQVQNRLCKYHSTQPLP